MSPQRRVVVHIDRLVLRGLPLSARERAHLERTLTGELTRLFAAAVPEWRDGRGVPAVTATPMQLAAGATGTEIGRRLAASLYRSMAKL